MNQETTRLNKIDLTNCDKEPIHRTIYIQPHGYLVCVLIPNLQIAQVSQNIIDLVGCSAEEIIGESITKLNCKGLAEIIQVGLNSKDFQTLNPTTVICKGGSDDHNKYNLIIHESEGYLILEFEPVALYVQNQNITNLMTASMSKLQNSYTIQELFWDTAWEIKRITGYDRVMIYRFAEDWHGEVVAEARNDHLIPYLGLHYPASDIPKQARELYKKNVVRIIVDVDAPNVAIHPPILQEKKEPGDLSNSVLRAVSPIHIQYLKNMGVAATLTISLIKDDILWGLIACHHGSPKFVDYNFRETCKFLSQIFSSTLNHKIDDNDLKKSERQRAIGHFLFEKMTQEWDVVKGLANHQHDVMDLIECSGAIIVMNENKLHLGETPNPEQTEELIEWLHEKVQVDVFDTYCFPQIWSEAQELRPVATGMLAICINHSLKEYVIWFRPEVIKTINWGGDPRKPVEVSGTENEVLSPRKSFAKWTQEVHGQSVRWTSVDLEVAHKLKKDINYILLQKANEFRRLNEKLSIVNKELEDFSHTISHDLKSPLTAIKSYAEIVLQDHSGEINQEIKKMLEKVLGNSERMESMIHNILEYSKVGKGIISYKKIDVQSVIDEIYDDLRLNERNRSIQFDVTGTPPVWGDPTMIHQLFYNLLSNAFKYTRKAEKAKILVSGKEESEQVIYKIQDNGVGIEMKEIDTIFQIFTRLHSESEFEGSGIGLSIAKRIMEKHKGRIWVESQPGKQTCFFVTFPTKPILV